MAEFKSSEFLLDTPTNITIERFDDQEEDYFVVNWDKVENSDNADPILGYKVKVFETKVVVKDVTYEDGSTMTEVELDKTEPAVEVAYKEVPADKTEFKFQGLKSAIYYEVAVQAYTAKQLEHQHIRYDPLKDDWVLISPHRCQRPWSGQTEGEGQEQAPDPNNPLMPNAVRPNGQKNPNYKATFVFPNDFPALLERVPEPPPSENPLFRTAGAKGHCRVMCYHPDSTMTTALMTVDEILAVVEQWVNQIKELGRRFTWVQIFENKGTIMGCSNPHPHCQVWASSYLPNEPRVKERTQKEYFMQHKRPMLADYLRQELENKERIVVKNSEWVALVPYWAVWPYETMLLPINGLPQRLTDLSDDQKRALAEIIKELTTKYDNLFKCNFPYSMGWHGAPTGPTRTVMDSPHWLLHAIYLPPLLRSATVKKFMVGYELLAQVQRDLTPELAAEKLRECDTVHYKCKQ